MPVHHRTGLRNWRCVAARLRQKLAIPIGGGLIVLISIPIIITAINHSNDVVPIPVYITPTHIVQIVPSDTLQPSNLPNETVESPTNFAPSPTIPAINPTETSVLSTDIPDNSNCQVTPLSSQNVNLRSGPGSNFGISGRLASGQSAEVNGYTVDRQDIKWWQIADGGWVREDVVSEVGTCDRVPLVPQDGGNIVLANPTATTIPSATTRPTVTPVPTRTSRPPSTATLPPRPTAVTPINATINTDRLNIRRGPGPEYEVVTTVSRGDRLSLVGRNSDGTWAQINTSDARWVNVSLLQINGSLLSLPVTYQEIGAWGPAGQATGARARALTVLRLRGCPGEDCRQLENPDTLEEGDTVDIVGRSADGMWYQVNINNRSAWIRSDSEYVELRGNRNATIPITD